MEISKQFEFDYGHRVWTQELNQEYSIDNRTVCRHLHGHRGHLEIVLEGEVGASGMVTDFKHLNWFKKWVDDNIDHKFLVDENDPMIHMIIPDYHKRTKTVGLYSSIIWIHEETEPNERELLESFVIVDFVPTSENICSWIHKIVQDKMDGLGVKVSQVIFKETPKSKSTFKPE